MYARYAEPPIRPARTRGEEAERSLGESVEADPDADAGDGAQALGAYYAIEGGIPLRGDVRLSGAKNAVTKLMVATLLTDDICIAAQCAAQPRRRLDH